MSKNFIEAIHKKIPIQLTKNHFFIFIYLICFFLYGYNKILFMRPVGIHQWRNSISAAIALNCYHEGDVFKSKTNLLLADNRTSDISIVEFPIVYIFVSWLYHIFGYQEFLFRLVQVLISFIGLFYLFKTAQLILKDTIYSLFSWLIVFTSPVYVFYTNNFIPDATCLSVAFIGIYFFFKYYFEHHQKYWILSMIFFCLAGLIKTPSLIFYLVIGGIFFFELIFGFNSDVDRKVMQFKPVYFITFALVGILLFLWYLYAKLYTDIHGGSISPVAIRPIWRLDNDVIHATWEAMKRRFNHGIYHNKPFLILSAVLLIVNVTMFKRYKRFYNLITGLVLIGAIGFSLFFYRSMKDHDYYQINNLILPLFLVISFFVMLKERYPKVYKSFYTKLIVATMGIYSIIHCTNEMDYYYSDWHYNWSNKNVEMYGQITPYLRSLGIERTDTVYMSPDPSVDISLYLADQKGFTDINLTQGIHERIEYLKTKGLQYIVIGDPNEFCEKNNINNLSDVDLGKLIGEMGSTKIYQVK